MKKHLFILFVCLMPLLASAQEARPFEGTIRNGEYSIFVKMNFYDKNITAEGCEMFGEIDGYFGSPQSYTKWYIVSSRITGSRSAEIEVVNDYGSEDFIAELKADKNGSYTLHKKSGSTLKFAVRGKWQKLPGKITLTR